MLKPESYLENATYQVLWDFEIQTDHPITATRHDLVFINKKKRMPSNGFSRSSEP